MRRIRAAATRICISRFQPRDRSAGRHVGKPVVAAFWIFPPLGIAALAYLLWRSARAGGGCGFSRNGWRGDASDGRWRGPATGNSAFEEHRRATLKELDGEAKAFDAFERRRREARDREAFDRFMAERNAPKSPDEPK